MVDGRPNPLIFDASPLIALLKGESGAERTRDLLRDAAAPRVAHALNLCEVYYHFVRLMDEPRVAAAMDTFERGGLIVRTDLEPSLWRTVAHLKAEFSQASLADCVGIALARKLGGTLVTADHPSFGPMVAAGVCPVLFIR